MSHDLDYLNDALDRIVAMEKEALSSLATPVTADAVPYWPYQQEEFPYFTNRLGSYDQLFEHGEDISTDSFSVVMRLVVAHVDEGYEGESNDRIHQWIIAIMNFFRNRRFLTSTTYATEYDYVSPDTGAFIGSHTGVVIFRNAGILAQQLGVEFTLNLPVLSLVD